MSNGDSKTKLRDLSQRFLDLTEELQVQLTDAAIDIEFLENKLQQAMFAVSYWADRCEGKIDPHTCLHCGKVTE